MKLVEKEGSDSSCPGALKHYFQLHTTAQVFVILGHVKLLPCFLFE